MKTVEELLDQVKAKAGITSDYALAKLLDISSARVCDYYKGRRFPDQYTSMKISAELDKPLAEVIAAVEIQAEKDEKRREAWKSYMKRLNGIAASVAICLLIVVTMKVSTADAEAAPLLDSESMQFVLC